MVKNEYPYTEDNMPLVDEATLGQFEVIQMPPLRRVFLIHTDHTYLMQLQPDRFVHNWRKTKDSDEYPNFEAAKQKFLHGWGLLQRFVAERQLGTIELKSYEVTYINHFIEKPGSFPLAAEAYIPVFNWKSARSKEFLPSPNVLGLDLRFPMPDNKGVLRVSVKHGKRLTDDADVMLMQMTAQGPAKPEESDMESYQHESKYDRRAMASVLCSTCALDSAVTAELTWSSVVKSGGYKPGRVAQTDRASDF